MNRRQVFPAIAGLFALPFLPKPKGPSYRGVPIQYEIGLHPEQVDGAARLETFKDFNHSPSLTYAQPNRFYYWKADGVVIKNDS